MKFEPSKYQKDIFSWVQSTQETNKKLVVEAVAGSGKTTTGIEMLKYVPEELSVVMLAFNRHIAQELSGKVPEHVWVKTYHALGLQIISDNLGRPKVDGRKSYRLLERYLSKEYDRALFYPASRLLGLLKGNLLEPTSENLWDLTTYHGLDLNDSASIVHRAVKGAFHDGLEETSIIDFDDMCHMPVYMDLKPRKYDFLFVDELQDTNKVQSSLVEISIKDTGRIVGVGDTFQSIYAFRGADSEAIPGFISKFDAETLPLSITYRNPLKVVSLVNEMFPEIHFESWERAKDGTISSIKYSDALIKFKPGDMILCRTNAPLVAPAFSLIRRGIKAIIRGRDIGKNLKTLITKMKPTDIQNLMQKLRDYEDREVSKLLASDRDAQAQALQDKIETIYALSDGVNSVDDLNGRIDTVFSDENEGVVFSSIHKAKGLESKNVYILKPELLPHPMARKSWEIIQERNIQYVAYTRSLDTLTFVTHCP